MDFVNCLLGLLILLSLGVMTLVAASWYAGRTYDAWVEEFEREGIKTALEPVLQGSDVVGYTVVKERRANRV